MAEQRTVALAYCICANEECLKRMLTVIIIFILHSEKYKVPFLANPEWNFVDLSKRPLSSMCELRRKRINRAAFQGTKTKLLKETLFSCK